MCFFFKLLFCGSAGTSALNLVNFLVPWDPFSRDRNNLLYQLYTVFIFFWCRLSLVNSLLTGFPTPAHLHSFLTQPFFDVGSNGPEWRFCGTLVLQAKPCYKENATGLSTVSNDNAQLLRWETSSLKHHRILKLILAERRVRGKNQYWTVLKCFCSAAVLSGLYRPFKSCCQQMEEIWLLKSQGIINSVFDLQLCTVYKKNIICHTLLPYSTAPVGKQLRIREVHYRE